jgi:hypothetical protein
MEGERAFEVRQEVQIVTIEEWLMMPQGKPMSKIVEDLIILSKT